MPTMKANDVTNTLEMALVTSGCGKATLPQKHAYLVTMARVISLANWLIGWVIEERIMFVARHSILKNRARLPLGTFPAEIPCWSTKRWRQTMKNRVLLENYYLPDDLDRQIKAFVAYNNNERYHESLNNLTPADVYFGRDKGIIRERKKIKRNTINQRRLQHFRKAV